MLSRMPPDELAYTPPVPLATAVSLAPHAVAANAMTVAKSIAVHFFLNKAIIPFCFSGRSPGRYLRAGHPTSPARSIDPTNAFWAKM